VVHAPDGAVPAASGLPPFDAVVLSHLHGDHFDRVARRSLPKDVPVLTTRQAARRLRLQGFVNAVALDTWQSYEITKSRAQALAVILEVPEELTAGT